MNRKKANAPRGKKRPNGNKRRSFGAKKSGNTSTVGEKSNNRNRSRGRGRGKQSGRKRPVSAIPVDKFIHKGIPVQEAKYEPEFLYSEYPLHPKLLKNLKHLGYTHPTEVQEKTIQPISLMKNVMAIANTGTGKTASFLIPIINSLLTEDTPFTTLIMVPTRELALQVEDEFRNLSHGLKLYATCVIGGQNIDRDLKKLSRPNHFIIGTPGRLVDLSKRNALRYEDFSVLVLDEFDRMLDMGFSKDVDFITQKMKHRDQTLLFSATIDKTQLELINKLMPEYEEVKVTDGTSTAEHIDQDVVYADHKDKFDVLLGMLKDNSFEKVLVFAETKRKVGNLTKQLKKSKIKADEIHGDKSQNYRKNALKAFRNGRVEVLVATDVAARGLDIKDVTHVINYEQPQDYETYIHRIGRTGRAGKVGKAFTFVNNKN